ncbi:unnamed protein product [Peronospora belbahrii]|uniref:Protein kinase domain-containing protein n=1 Tax=Peronospora belbahrii TaxID=622444 RepID=A0ABN8CXJ3_9STRA|nr:unnamed protein product [Peronospora belbahrii]
MDNTPQLSHVTSKMLPSDLEQMLSIHSLTWNELPGLLQRAFLWDAGYVLTSTHSLSKVYTRCGRSMAELVIPSKAFERIGCQLKHCVLPDGTSFYRSLDCKASHLFRLVQCAVDASQDISAPAYAAVWGDGGNATTLPEVTVQRHAYLDNDGASNLIFALHTTHYEVADTQCPLVPAMVIPCAPYNLVNQSTFCTPEPGIVASAWLKKYGADQKGDQTWLLVPLCIVTFLTFGTVAVYRYKSALRDEAQREVDQFMRENRHLFDNGAVEAFLAPKRKGKGRLWSSHTAGSSRQNQSSWDSSSFSSDEHAYSSRSSVSRSQDSGLDGLEASLSCDEGIQNAAIFEHFDATIGLSASSFDPLRSNARIHPLQTEPETSSLDTGTRKSTTDELTVRKNEMTIQSFRLFESHRKIRRLRVPVSELQLLRRLSSGSTGEVWLALHKNAQVAIKQLVPEKRRLLPETEMFLAEIYLMAQLKHPHIVTLNGIAWNTLERVVMVQEYMEGGDLYHFLAQQRTNNSTLMALSSSSNTALRRSGSMSGGLPQVDEVLAAAATSPASFASGLGAAAGGLLYSSHSNHFTWSKQKLAIAQAVTSALSYLHALVPKVLHHDVKSRNVLLSSSLDAKLCDFGISRRKCTGKADKINTAAAGTLSWTAPELLLGEDYTEKVDIYSLGILFSELDTCMLPYHDPASLSERLVQHPLRLMRRIVDDGLRPQLSPDCPLPITHLIAACLSRNPKLRPSAADVGAWLASARGERLLRKDSKTGLIP